MKNTLILGAGRSGTSMVAGTLAEAGYYMGDTMLNATEANPKGYFESREVETVNDEIVSKMLNPGKKERLLQWFQPIPKQPNLHIKPAWAKVHWLALVPPNREYKTPERLQNSIKALVDQAPFCFKDPRFCYTLPNWRPFLKDTVFICVFRNPTLTATSILKDIQRESYLEGIDLSFDQALLNWWYMYRHVLENHRQQGQWLFLHYDQVLTAQGLDKIAQFTGAQVNHDFPDVKLKRTTSDRPIPPKVARVYRQLCQLAGYADE